MNIYSADKPWVSFDVDEQIELYLSSCRSRRLSSQTLTTYRHNLDHLSSYCKKIGVSDVTDLSAIILRNYIEDVQTGGPRGKRSAYTVHCAYRVMRSFFTFLHDEEVIVTNPIKRMKAPRLPKQILPSLTLDEVNTVINYWSGWEKKPRNLRNGLDLFELRNLTLFLFMLDSGVRVEECSRVMVSDVDLASGRVFVRCGKGEKDRITFVSEATLKYLRQYLKLVPSTESRLWIGQYGPMGAKGIQMIFKRLSREVGFRVSPHKIRRTFAIMMLRNGADLYRLKELMGHSDIRTLERYLAITSEDLQKCFKNASPVDAIIDRNS